MTDKDMFVRTISLADDARDFPSKWVPLHEKDAATNSNMRRIKKRYLALDITPVVITTDSDGTSGGNHSTQSPFTQSCETEVAGASRSESGVMTISCDEPIISPEAVVASRR